MVKTYFDLYGPHFVSLKTHEIDNEHVTIVGLIYSFYVAKVGNPTVDRHLHSSTNRKIKCDLELVFHQKSGGRTGGITKRDKDLFGPCAVCVSQSQDDCQNI